MKYLLLLIPTLSFACRTDYDCQYGSFCIRTNKITNGICMEMLDKYGVKDYTKYKYWGKGIKIIEVEENEDE